MFQNPRYLTRGVQASVPLDIQLLLWSLIEEAREKTKLDYLQVFRLEVVGIQGVNLQSIEHHQEQPEYRENYILHVSEPINITVWVIDDEDHSTMLLPDEY